MKKNISIIQADLLLLLVAILWGTTFITSKFSLEVLEPLTIIAIRFVLAFIMMLVFFYKQVKTMTFKEIKQGSVVGIILFLACTLQLIGLKTTAPGKQAFLAATYVIFVPFILWFIKRKQPDSKALISAFACFIGIGFLTLKDGFQINAGDTLTIISSVFYGLHIIATEHYVKIISPVKVAIIQFGVVAILASTSALIFEGLPSTLDLSSTIGLLYLGIICTGVTYYLQTFAQNYTKSTHTSIILSMEAVIGSILPIILIHEIFTPQMMIGCVIIFTSILVIELKDTPMMKKKKNSTHRKAV